MKNVESSKISQFYPSKQLLRQYNRVMSMKNSSTPQNSILIPKTYIFYNALLVLLLVTFIIYRETSIHHTLSVGRFYEDVILNYKLHPAWKMNKAEIKKEEQMIDKLIIEHGNNQISRDELGRNSWGLLHMITTSFPIVISPELRQQFNTFLVLFAKFYPCKLCANHFMKFLKKEGPFYGQKKGELMEYMCRLHNRVNLKLGKPHYDCDLVATEWATCGCTVLIPWL